MRKITKIVKNIVVESNVNEKKIYAFKDRDDISFLCRKDGKLFWKCLGSVELVWYKKYDTIQEAINGVISLPSFINRDCGAIIEFDSTKELVGWAYSEFNLADFDDEKTTSESIVVRIDESKPHALVLKKTPFDYWYFSQIGAYFNVRPATSKSDIMETESFGGVDISEVLIVTDGEFKGNALIKSHCLCFCLK